jgi:hypothetical protein
MGMVRDSDDSQVLGAIGTAFSVGVPTAVPDRSWIYVVTAAHVVESGSQTWIRVRMKDGSLRELSIPKWTSHPRDDVAVAFMGYPDVDMTLIPVSRLLDEWPTQPMLGDRVYFLGLLALAESMVEENVPMVRSGTLGRLYQDRVPLRHSDDRVTRHQVHLIDCRSYGGFSGSPCFVQFRHKLDKNDPPRTGAWIGGIPLEPDTVCLGLISGHWDDMARAEASGDLANDPLVKSIRFPINTGVGIVTPAERIRECLMDEELVADRAARDAQLVRNQAREEKEGARIGYKPPPSLNRQPGD